ncbi:MAG: flagellar biosynthetic protein FliO [Deltaproteobacteria bacterium]|nr:flagellar biosynthetic protein FliO [Deltaproteobacteria bacterium]
MEMIWAAVKMVFAMGAGLALLYLLIRFTKRLDLARRSSSPDAGIKVLTNKLIAPQKYISLVEIGGEILALGISAQQVTFLTKIENKERVKENLEAPAGKPEPLSWFQFWPARHKRIKTFPLGVWHEK